jgi:hypothetical protein
MAIVVGLIAPSSAWARQPKTYQVTGKVLEVQNDLIIVQKDEEKWEIARDVATKVTGELKVGAKVTIEYRMAAATVEVKKDDAKKEEPKKK